MAKPVITFPAGDGKIIHLDELSNPTGSTFLLTKTINATFSDDDGPGAANSIFVATVTPVQPITLPGSVHAQVSATYNASTHWTGTVAVTFSGMDNIFDFVPLGKTYKQDVKFTVTDTQDGTHTDTIIHLEVKGTNDMPVAHRDTTTIHDDVSTLTYHVLNNDHDPDRGETELLRINSAKVLSVFSAGEPFLDKSMVHVSRVNTVNHDAPAKNALKLTFDHDFRSLATGENAQVKVQYEVEDPNGSRSTTTLTVTVTGKNDTTIDGTSSSDKHLHGESNADKIYGLGGNDTITPGGGHDSIWGGSGNDHFVFNAASDSKLSNPDDIMDFSRGHDKIDLTGLGVSLVWKGTDAFDTTGGAEFRYVKHSGYVTVQIDTDGNHAADMAIDVHNTTRLTSSDFLFIETN